MHTKQQTKSKSASLKLLDGNKPGFLVGSFSNVRCRIYVPRTKKNPDEGTKMVTKGQGGKVIPPSKIGCLETQHDSTACQHIVSATKAWRSDGLYAHDP